MSFETFKQGLYSFIEFFKLPFSTEAIAVGILVFIGILLTALILFFAVKIDEFIYWNFTIKRKIKKKKTRK